MRIAVIADIHGNSRALEAVLADLAGRRVDLTVNLGDIVSGPLEPGATADRLMALDLPTIRGNHERQLLAPDLDAMGESDRHAAVSLRPDQLGWLARLPATMRLDDGILLCHGDPSSDVAYFMETVEEAGCRPATLDEIEARAECVDASLILCGHTHVARIIRLRDGRIVLNPGSVGLPAYHDDKPFAHRIETGTPHARYAVVERRKGEWAADFIAVSYDWNAAAETAARRNRPDWASGLRSGRLSAE